jgi:hypothetical protein
MKVICVKDYDDFKSGEDYWVVGEDYITWGRWDSDEYYIFPGDEVNAWGELTTIMAPKEFFKTPEELRDYKINTILNES